MLIKLNDNLGMTNRYKLTMNTFKHETRIFLTTKGNKLWNRRCSSKTPKNSNGDFP